MNPSSMRALVEQLGGPVNTARALGVSYQLVQQWAKDEAAGPPASRCVEIERATNGKAQCEQLRPDVAWRRIADSSWPWHPKGRPLVDLLPEPKGKRQRETAKPIAGGGRRAGCDRREHPDDVTGRRAQERRHA